MSPTPSTPPLLRSGDRVAVVASSGIFEPERLAAGMALLRRWGLEPVEAAHLHARHRYTAGTVQERRDDLVAALQDPEIQAVWLARGGYGAVHLLDGLADALVDDRPLIGFSDATALFCALDRAGVGCRVHGPVLHSLADLADGASQDALRGLLLEGGPQVLPGEALCGPWRVAEGRVVGGNLCVLASLAGTPWALDGHDAIVVLEDIAEPPYKLDRMITQLRLSGAFDGVRGVALGSFTGTRVPEDADWTLDELLSDLLEPLGVPVVHGLPVGHGTRNHAWLHGAIGRLDPGVGLVVGG